MLDVLEKLLILQDRDRKLLKVNKELAHVEPERQALQSKAQSTQSALEAVKLRMKQIESDRKQLELEAASKKQQIDRYSVQQFQTKKNEEYRALGVEIENGRVFIRSLEDKQIELMEQTEVAQKEMTAAAAEAAAVRKSVEAQVADLAERERNLKKELVELEANRTQLATGVEEGALSRYERLLKNKGDTAIVGIEHGVCGGCHMKLPMQSIVSSRSSQELITCPNCGRILYYTRDMDLTEAD